MEKKSYILIIFLAAMFIIGFFKHDTGFIKDVIFSVFLIIVLFFLYAKIRLTPISYSLVCFSLIVHNLGTFGFYANPPIFNIPYDVITHILGFFTVTIVIANFLSFSLTKSKKFKFNDFIVLMMIFLAALGIGAIVETMEFTGYLVWGQGEGFFQFGSGDLNNADLLTQVVGGGYFDTMGDLICNMVGALSAVILFWMTFFIFKKQTI
jgi:uncharacterized membrane protein YjdF